MAAKGRRKLWGRLWAVFLLLFVAGFGILLWKLVKLQIFEHTKMLGKSSQQQLGEQVLAPLRGTIYDRNMTPLAKSAKAWDVAVSPAYIPEKLRAGIADRLSEILRLDRGGLYKQLGSKSGYLVIAKKVGRDAYTKISDYIKENHLGCIRLEDNSERYYPLGNFAAQLLGFTGADGQGLEGIEAEYDSVLAGTPGRAVYEKTAIGGFMPYSSGDDVPAKDGDNLVLTIDEQIQQVLENHLKQALGQYRVANRLTGIVMDVDSGEILGMATSPGYDPNSPMTLADAEAKKALAKLSGKTLKQETTKALQRQWRNKAISEPYEPGSTFKIITAAAALQEGVVTQDTQFDDPGYVIVAGRTINNWMRQGQGRVSFLQGFEYSNDTVFIKTGLMLGAARFFQYFGDFGLTEKTGIDLPGESGSLYYDLKTLGPVQLASESFGQSDKITAVQLVTAVSAAANGGYLVQPHVVKAQTDSAGNIVRTFPRTVKRQVISARISQEINSMLNAEVSIGTGKNAYVAGYRIGGKTGTSEKLDTADPNDVVSSMIGVAPTDSPRVAVLVVMDDPHSSNNYGGVIAAPIIGGIMSEILPYLGVVPKYNAAELTKLAVKTPSVTGKSQAAAAAAVKAARLNVRAEGSGGTVTGQVPAAGESVPQGGSVTIYLGGAKVKNAVTVPSVIGYSVSAAYKAISGGRLNPQLEGAGMTDAGMAAYEQKPAAGAKVPPGTVVTVKFRNDHLKVR